MNKIQSFEQYKEIVADAKKNGCKLSNCFFMPAAIRQKIADGTLYFESIDGGLLILEDFTDFYRCYYYLSESADLKPVSFDKQTVVEFPFTGDLGEKQKLQISKIEAMGFHLGRESGLMVCPSDRIVIRTIDQPDFFVETATENDAQKVYALFTGNFNPLYAYTPTLSELYELIGNGYVLVIRSGDDIAAALVCSAEKGVATSTHLIVDSAYRGKKLGLMMFQAYHKKYMDEVTSFQHWVDRHNTLAINMYYKFGYEFSPRNANEYIL